MISPAHRYVADAETRRTADLLETLLGADRVVEVLRDYRLSQAQHYQNCLDRLRALRAHKFPVEPSPKNGHRPTHQGGRP